MSLAQLTSSPATGSNRAGRPKRLPVWLLPVGLLLGFAALFALLLGPRLLPALPVRTVQVVTLRQAPSDQDPRPAAPETAAALPTPTGPVLFQASGWIEPDPYPTLVSTLIDGVVSEIHILQGEQVKKGQLLATLVDDDARLNHLQAGQRIASIKSKRVAHCAAIPVLEAEQEAAEKKIAAEEAQLAELRDTADRYASLSKGSVSEQQLTQARLQVERQLAIVAEARAALPRLDAMIAQVEDERTAIDNSLLEAETDLARMKLALDRTRITAPMDGVVLRLHASPGSKRMLGMDDPKSALIVELFDPLHLQARIDVPLNEAAALRVGQPVNLTTDLLPDLKLAASVTRIVGEADIARNTLQAKVRLHNPDPRLRPEMLVRAAFHQGGSAPPPDSGSLPPPSSDRLALFAPRAALFDLSGSTAKVWLANNNRAELRTITVGTESRDEHLPVLDGLRSGDLLILPPHNKLSANKRIAPSINH